MAGSSPAIIRETRRGQAVFMAQRPEEPPGGSQSVRSSEEAGNDRGAKGTQEGGCVMNRNDDAKPAPVAAAPKQAGEAHTPREPWWWVERGVWTERRLTRLTSGESANRVWFALWDKTYAPANLQSAFDKVWRNGGSAGADAQTVAHFAKHAEEELSRLAGQMSQGTYRPQPVRRAWIPKPGSKEKRPLGIPAVRDRIVQGALRHVLEPIFETEFAGHSYGFRPGRVVDASAPGGFDFLGYHFERGRRWPRKQSLEKLRERVRAKTPRLDGRSLTDIVTDVNRTLRGWYGYFQHSQANVFAAVDGYVRRRLRSLLEKRRGRTRQGLGAAHRRWPNEWFAHRGLLSLKAEHEWTRTIVRLRTH